MPAFEHREHLLIDGHLLLRLVCFDSPDMLPDDAPLNMERAVEPIHIAPSQAEGFTNPKPKRNAQQGDGSNWFLKMREKPSKFILREIVRLPQSFVAPLMVTNDIGLR